MSLMDDVDFQFQRCGHGWSEASLYINSKRHVFYLTHIFQDPLEAVCLATVTLSKGYDKGCFSWSDEPGQYDWKLSKNVSDFSLLDVLIYIYPSCTDGCSQEGSAYLLEQEIVFTVERNFWIDLVTIEAEKIAKLLTYNHYQQNRDAHTFPWQELKQLKQYQRSR